MRHRKRMSIVLLTLALLPLGAAAAPVAALDLPPAAPIPPTAQAVRHVTLPTGDRVTVTADHDITFTPGAGRAGTAYATQTIGDHVLVIPADAWKSVASGNRDRNAFDVTRLAGLTGSIPARTRVAAAADTVRLTVRYLDTAGRPPAEYLSTIQSVADGSYLPLHDPDGTAEIDVPKGRYVLDAWIRTDTETKPKDHLLVAPGLDLNTDTTIVMDARRTRQHHVTVQNRSVRPVQAEIGYTLLDDEVPLGGGLGGDDPGTLYTAQVGRALPADEFVSYTMSRWAVPGPTRDFRNTPVSYGLIDVRHGSMFTGFRRHALNSSLATVRTQYNEHTDGVVLDAGFDVGVPGTSIGRGYVFAYDEPATTTAHLEGGDAVWGAVLWERANDDPEPITEQSWSRNRTLVAGRHYTETWSRAVFGPVFNDPNYVYRDGEYIGAYVLLFTDADDRHGGWSQTDKASTRLYRDDVLVVESDELGSLPRGTTLPPERARYRLTATADRPSFSRFSTRIEASWTFESEQSAEQAALPLWAIRFHPEVDARNRAAAGPVVEIPVVLQPQPQSPVGTAGRPVVEISGDDGKTWHRATVTENSARRYVAKAPTPAGATYISVRASMRDSLGNTVRETIVRAYALR